MTLEALIRRLLINGILLNSLATGDWYHRIPETHFFLSLCILHRYMKLIFISEKENKGCSEAQESLPVAELEPQGAALGEPAHTVGCPPVPLTQHDRVSHTGTVTRLLEFMRFQVFCLFICHTLSVLTVICSPPSVRQRGQPGKLICRKCHCSHKLPAASWPHTT